MTVKMKEVFVILILLAGTVVSFPYSHHPNHFTRRLLNDVVTKDEPPKAKKVKHEMEMFGDLRVDNYYWLRDDNGSDPQVLSYINEENNYTELIMSSTKDLQDKFFDELSGQLNENETSVPRRIGPYYYYERTLTGNGYNYQICRRLAPNRGDPPSVYDVMSTGPDSFPEHVMLDTSLRAQGHPNYYLGAFTVSPNHNIVAYAEDIQGDNNYTASIIDAESTEPVEKSLVGLTNYVVWAGNEGLLYITKGSTQRLDKVWLHKLGEEQSNDLCLYYEKDEKFSLDIHESRSRKFLFVRSQSTTTSFTFYFDIVNPEQGLIPLTPRVEGINTLVDHRGIHFFIQRTSEILYNSELLACPVDNVSAITTILPHRESVKITSVQLFFDHLVLYERENGLPKVTIFKLPPLGDAIGILQRAHAVEFMDSDYGVSQIDSDYNSSILRFYYGTLRTPNSVYDYDMNTGIAVLKGKDTVSSDFDSSNYFTDRIWATASDGIQVPMSIVYKKDLVKLNGSNPVLLYGSGAYEVSIDPFFISIIPLLDRGFIYVLAHVRGGGEFGTQWHNNGKLLNKKNTFSDFIACAEYLIERKYCTKENLVIEGSYEGGGLLIGVVVNMRPDLFKVAIAKSPFLDVVTTMLDQTVPDIVAMRKEWGDPREEEFYHYMKSYSPVDNVLAQNYPSILVLSDSYPSRVTSESAKFVAKLRDMKTDKNMLLFKSGASDGLFTINWRSESIKEVAFKYAFILKALNM